MQECGEPLTGRTPKEIEKWLKKFQLTEEQRTKFHMMLSKAQAEYDNLVQDQMYVTRLATQWGIPAADALTMQPDDTLKVMTMLAIVTE
jgi:Spy/CpxP family protein refolding chaperone